MKIMLKCPHCGNYYHHNEEREACYTGNWNILFKPEDPVLIKLPKVTWGCSGYNWPGSRQSKRK
jgi:hypothetical protein